MKRFWGVLFFLVLIVVPLFTYAAGLVPCGGPNEPACQTCHVIELVNRVVSWLVLILGTVAAIIIVYAGFKLVTSGGNRHAKEDAKSMISNMIIGYCIVLAGWLLVDTGMKMLLTDGETVLGVWNQVSCTDQPEPKSRSFTPTVFEPDTSIPSTPGAGVNVGNTQTLTCSVRPNGSDICTYQQDQCTRSGGVPTIDSSTSPRSVVCKYYVAGGVTGSGGTLPPNISGTGACNPYTIAKYFPTGLVGSAQCIIGAESSCGARSQSITDVMNIDKRPFSFGPMQINLTVHVLQGCSGYPATLNCYAAFAGKNYSARVVDEGLYQTCAKAAQNVDCNIKNGYRIYQEAGNRWSPWSTASACGL
jgi:hypothetical protein